MILKKITFDNKSDLEFIERLYIESFPRNERRPILEMYHLIEDENRFNLFSLETKNNIRVGFITYWDLDDFIFIEHFAVSSEFRNLGYGNNAVDELIKQTFLPLIAEIELPMTSELAKRRVNFYERLGFQIWRDLSYEQPPYEEGFNSIPMLLITYRDFDLSSNFTHICNSIHKEVYNVNTNDC